MNENSIGVELYTDKYSKMKFFLLIIALVSLFGNLKFFIFVFCCMSLFIFNSKAYVAFLKDALPAFILIFSLAFFSIALGNSPRYVTLESRDIIIFFLVFILLKTTSKYIFREKEVINVLISLFVILAVIKVMILFYCILKGIPASEVVRGIREFTGWGLQTYDVQDTFLARIQFPIDLVSCFIIVFHLQRLKETRSLRNWIYLLLLLFSILMSMSRAFWFICLVNVFCFVFLVNKGRIKTTYFIVTIVLFIFLMAIFYNYIGSIIGSRLSSTNNYYSDLERTIQDMNIKEKISDAYWFGHGIGYYIPNYLRSYVDGYKYAYESQVLATIMKIGLVGFFLFIICVLYVCFRAQNLSSIPWNLFLLRLIMLILWIFSGYYNPLLFNVPAGMILYLTTEINRENLPGRV